MKTYRWILTLALILIGWGWSGTLQAQYIIRQQEYDGELNYNLLPDNVQEPEEEAQFFLNLPEDQLKNAMQSNGGELQVTSTTMYMDGDNLAVESETPDGKTSMVSNSKEGTFYMINWAQRQVVVMSSKDIDAMKAESEKAREQAMQNLSPEERQQVEAAEQAEQAEHANREGPTAEATGKTMKKHGFDCRQYLIQQEDETMAVWASSEYRDLAEIISRITKEWDEAFAMEDEGEDEEADEWELLPGQVPVEVRAYQGGMMGTPSMSVTAITGIEKRTPPAEVFRVPDESDGFTRQSMMELMQQMMQMMQQGQEQ